MRLHDVKTALLLLLCIPPIAACSVGERVGSIGKPPKLSQPDFGAGPAIVKPSVAPPAAAGQSASLYRSGTAGLFSDHRARAVGDMLIIAIDIADKADFSNSSSRSRGGSEQSGAGALFGLEKLVTKFVGLDTGNLIGADSKSSSEGAGKTGRSEKVSLRMTAVVTHVLPNGNLIIRGSQESRVNFEMRELTIMGMVRPVDIANDNSIAHDRIAEMRFSYGGKGQLSSAQQARWGQQLIDAVSPF